MRASHACKESTFSCLKSHMGKTAPTCDNQKCPDIAKCPQGNKLIPVENHRPKRAYLADILTSIPSLHPLSYPSILSLVQIQPYGLLAVLKILGMLSPHFHTCSVLPPGVYMTHTLTSFEDLPKGHHLSEISPGFLILNCYLPYSLLLYFD